MTAVFCGWTSAERRRKLTGLSGAKFARLRSTAFFGPLVVAEGEEHEEQLPEAEPTLEQRLQLAHDATAEREHADHEDDALRDRHPGAEVGQVVLHRQDHEGA